MQLSQDRSSQRQKKKKPGNKEGPSRVYLKQERGKGQ